MPCLLQCRNSFAKHARLVSHSLSALLRFQDHKSVPDLEILSRDLRRDAKNARKLRREQLSK
jgi:hypothetical protein